MHRIREKYRALRMLSLVLTIVGAISALFGLSVLVWGSFRLFRSPDSGQATAALYAMGAGAVCALGGLVVFAMSELIRLLIDVERNQRRQIQEVRDAVSRAQAERS